MLIFSELFLTVYSNHFELEKGVMSTPKHCSILSLIFTYVIELNLMLRNQFMIYIGFIT